MKNYKVTYKTQFNTIITKHYNNIDKDTLDRYISLYSTLSKSTLNEVTEEQWLPYS